jgi:hypothetical protein
MDLVSCGYILRLRRFRGGGNQIEYFPTLSLGLCSLSSRIRLSPLLGSFHTNHNCIATRSHTISIEPTMLDNTRAVSYSGTAQIYYAQCVQWAILVCISNLFGSLQ